MAKKPKKVSFGMCRDITLKHHDTWANGGGRRSAMSYSKHFLDIHGDEFDVYRITRRLILEDHQILREEHNFSNSALNRYNSAVRMPLIFCQEEWEIIDPYWSIPKFKRYSEQKTRIPYKPYTKDEVLSMCDYATNKLGQPELAEFMMFAALTGAREDKIVRITCDRVDLHNKVLTLIKTKDGTDRTVPIHESLYPMLVRRCTEREPDERVFSEYRNADQMYRQFKKCVHRHLLKPENGEWVFHGLRHSFGTWHCMDGTNLKDISAFMGHSSTKMTERYLHETQMGRHSLMNKVGFDVDADYSSRSTWKAS